MRSCKFNVFYTFSIYFRFSRDWHIFFDKPYTIECPTPTQVKDILMNNIFWRDCILACLEIDMLNYYGCLDADL